MFTKLREARPFPQHRKTTDFHQTPVFPQEIIDLIIDEVASQISPEALRPYSLISKSFHASCRRHSFSEIKITVDDLSHLRAQNLINVFKKPHNVDLLSTVRSLQVVFPSKKKDCTKRDIFRLPTWPSIGGRRENSFLTLLNLLSQAPLATFSLHALRTAPVSLAETMDDRTMEAFRSLCTKPSLHSLRLSNLNFLEGTLITEAIRANTLLELSLNNIALGWNDDEVNRDPNLTPIISRIEKLDIRSVSSFELFRIFGRSKPTSHPFVALPRLHSFVFSARCGEFEMQRTWAFIVEVANSLETLEIEDLNWIGLINLHQLTALRRLKIATQAESDLELFLQKESICQLLSSATPSSPLRIQSLTIEISMEMSLNSDPHGPYSISPWLDLDILLMQGAFLDLRRLDLNFQDFYHSSESQPPGRWKSGGDACRKRILPEVSGHPSIEFRLNTRTIYAPEWIPAYFSSQ